MLRDASFKYAILPDGSEIGVRPASDGAVVLQIPEKTARRLSDGVSGGGDVMWWLGLEAAQAIAVAWGQAHG